MADGRPPVWEAPIDERRMMVEIGAAMMAGRLHVPLGPAGRFDPWLLGS
jgi:hypothetical protein